MTVLGIIGCRIFEDETVHVLANDPDIDRVYLIKNEEKKLRYLMPVPEQFI